MMHVPLVQKKGFAQPADRKKQGQFMLDWDEKMQNG